MYDLQIGLRNKKEQPIFGYFKEYYDCYNYHVIWIFFFYIAWRTTVF